MSEPRYKSSRQLVDGGGTEDEELESKRRDRKALLRSEWIEKQMQSEVGQDFFHELIFFRTLPNVGVCGLHMTNLENVAQVEGARALQANIDNEVRSAARPSDYAAMIMRQLGGRRPESVTEKERKKS